MIIGKDLLVLYNLVHKYHDVVAAILLFISNAQ